jgi:hypothetical protein
MKVEQRQDVRAVEVADMEGDGHREASNFDRKPQEARNVRGA